MIMNKERSALIISLSSFIVWGMLVIYWHRLSDVDPVEVVAHRAIWSLVFTFILIICLRRLGEAFNILKTPKYILPLIVSSLLIAGNWGIFIWAVANERILESSMGYYINPLFNVAASALIFKTALNKVQKTAVLSAVIGVVYMIFVYGKVPYISIMLAASFCAYGIIKKTIPASALTGLFIETLIISVPSVIYIIAAIMNGTSAVQGGDDTVKILLICGGIVTTLPLMGFTYGARNLNLSTLGIIQYITPTMSFLLGIFLYNEHFNVSMLITFIFIWAGIIIYSADGILRLKFKK